MNGADMDDAGSGDEAQSTLTDGVDDPLFEPDDGEDDPLFSGEDGVLNQTELIRNPGLLEISTVPESDRIVGRTEQIRDVAMNIGPIVNGQEPSPVMIYGKTGTGKSLVSKHTSKRIVDQAAREGRNVSTAYIDCAQDNTKTQVVSKIARKLNIEAGEPLDIPVTGLGPSHYYQYIWTLLDEQFDGAIVILDEIDQLQPIEEMNNVLMQLSRAREASKTSAHIGIIGISNKIDFGESLNERVKSSLGDTEPVFPPYDANQLRSILEAREDAFYEDALSSSVIPRTAALAAREHGDARKAVRILKNAGKIAQNNGDSKVIVEHVNDAQMRAEVDRLRELLATDTPHARYVLLALAELTLNNSQDTFRTTHVFDVYEGVCEKEGADSLKLDRVRDLLRNHAFNDITESTLESGGRGKGTYKVHRLLKDPEVVRESVMREM